MPRAPMQKLKLLYIHKYLCEHSDEEHPVSMEMLLSHLDAQGIAAERKSIYTDMDALRLFGYDIRMTKSKPMGYYIANRDFELPELKLLVDSVQSSQFITEKKTLQLIKKLESLCSAHEAQQIRRQVYVSGRIKHMNESIYYSVDAIHTAIAEDRQIEFKYFDYNIQKKKVHRKSGSIYKISPFALTWDSQNYYMIGYDSEAEIIKHYRVDRMESINVSLEPRSGHGVFDEHDMNIYTHRTFMMFGGEEVTVDMEFENKLIGVVIDRFGKDIFIIPHGENRFRISAPVVVSPQFYAWVFGLGSEAEILAPKEVAEGMKKQLEEVITKY